MTETVVALPTGSEFLVNTITNGSQGWSSVAALANGNFLVTWDDTSFTDGSGAGIKAQIFFAGGQKIGAEIPVNTTVLNDQIRPTVATLADGGFVISWMDFSQQGADQSGFGIKAQVFDAAGQKAGAEISVNSVTLGIQAEPVVAALSNGNFIVTWFDYSQQGADVSGPGIKAQIFGATGQKIGSEFTVNTSTAGDQIYPTVSSLSNGRFVIAWEDASDGSDRGIRAQIFGADGQRSGGEFIVNQAIGGPQIAPAITTLSNGNFVVSWYDGVVPAIKAQMFAAGGARLGGEMLVSTGTGEASDGNAIIALPGGRFLVCWSEADGSSSGVKAQMFDAAGQKILGEFFVNTTYQNAQQFAAGSLLADGNVIVSWTDGSGVGGDASGSAIKAKIFNLLGIHSGTAGNDTLIGSELKDELTGLGGNDRLDGGANADKMTGGKGDDTYVVDHAGDSVIELGGTGEGIDTVETALSDYTLHANVENLKITGTGAVNVKGNELANEIIGNAGRNVIYAGAGDDVIHSGGGDDYLDGGTGADTFHGGAGNTQYVFDNARDIVLGEVAGGGSDTIWSSVSVDLNDQGAIEILRLNGSGAIDGTGNALANTITGSAGNNVIAGGLGNDTLYGKGGADIFVFDGFGTATKDSIWDFDADDKVSLDASVFQGLGIDSGHLAAANFVKGAAATVAGRATIIYTTYTGILYYDADGKGGQAAQEVAYIGKNLSFFGYDDILLG